MGTSEAMKKRARGGHMRGSFAEGGYKGAAKKKIFLRHLIDRKRTPVHSRIKGKEVDRKGKIPETGKGQIWKKKT